MVRASLKNPYAVVASCLIVVLLGVVSYQKMTVDIFPEIKVPVVAVATFYKGMGPNEIEGAISLRLEQLFLQASYVEHIESRSLPGVSLIKIYFHPEYNVDAGLSEITSLTYSALRFMPKGMFPPTIIKFGATNLPIANLVLSSPSLGEKEVRDIAYFTVRPQLGTVQGVSLPPTFGGTIRQITIFLDREKMLARGVSIDQVVKAVNTENLLVPAGDVKIGDFDYNVYSNSIVSLVEEMNDFPIKVTNGIPVFLKEVGTASDSTSVQVNVVRANGRRSVYVPILKQAGANTLKVIDGIRETLPKLKGIPGDLELKLIFDQSSYIRQSITTVQHEMLLGGGLACLMILVFLGSFRSMLIIALAIPISIASAFVLLYFTGHTINIMTLGGLALAVGTLVDNSIVVLENIHRHMELGKPIRQAAAEGASEVALPMLVITVSVLIVYLPIVFFTGTIKFLFVPLALAVAYAMGASYVASLTVAPVAIAASHRDLADVPALPENAPPTRPWGTITEAWKSSNLFERVADRYAGFLHWGLEHKLLIGAVVAVAFVVSIAFAPLLATEFFPKVDAGEFILNVAAPEGTRLEKTEAIVAKVEDVIRQVIPKQELNQLVSNIGLPQGWMVLYTPVIGPHQAFLMVSLVKGHTLPTDDYIERIRGRLSTEFRGLKFSFQTGGVVSDVINAGLPAPVDIKVSGTNLADMDEAAQKIRDVVALVPKTVDVRVQQGMDYPEIHLKINRVHAAYLGLTEQQILADVVTGLSSNISGDPGYWIDPKTNNAYFVVAQYPEQNLRRFEDFLLTPLIGSRTASDRVLHAESGEDLDAAAIHLHWDVDDDFAGGIAKHLPDPRVELEFLCGEVKAGRLRLPGVKFLLLLGGKRYYALFRVGGHRMISLGCIRNVNRRARGDKIWTCLSKLVSIDSRTEWRKCAYLAATWTLITSEIQLLVRSIPGMRKKILSISENDALRVTRHMLLENRGFDVVSTGNLRETRNALKSADFDLVILGISLDGELKREMVILTRKLCANAQILELCRISPEVPEAEHYLVAAEPEEIDHTVHRILRGKEIAQ